MAELGEVCNDDDPMGFVEGCLATVLFQQGVDQSPLREKMEQPTLQVKKVARIAKKNVHYCEVRTCWLLSI
jgi:hypothetical protein